MSIIRTTRLRVGKMKVKVWSVRTEPEREGAHVLIEFLAEGLALSRALAQDLQRSLGRPEGPHAVMDPARPQPALSCLKPPALTQYYIGDRYSHIIEVYLKMPSMDLIHVAKH